MVFKIQNSRHKLTRTKTSDTFWYLVESPGRRVGPLRVVQLLRPARSPRSQEWSRGRRCRDQHATTRSSRGPYTADGPGSAHGRRCRLYSAVQLRRGPRTAHGPSWSRGLRCPAEHAARCRSCGVADGVVNQVGPSGTAHGSSELVKAHTPRRGRHSCRNSVVFRGRPDKRGPWNSKASPSRHIFLWHARSVVCLKRIVLAPPPSASRIHNKLCLNSLSRT